VDEDEREPDVPDLPVELKERVLAEWRSDRSEARYERELEAHHREPHEAEGDREVGQEPVVGVVGSNRRENEWRKDRPEVREYAERRSDDQCHSTEGPVGEPAPGDPARPTALRRWQGFGVALLIVEFATKFLAARANASPETTARRSSLPARGGMGRR